MTDDPPSPAERAFLDLLRRPAAYARWAAQVRAEWVARKKAVARKDELGQGGEVGLPHRNQSSKVTGKPA